MVKPSIFFTFCSLNQEVQYSFFLITGKWFIGFTVEDDEGKVAERPILGAVCG